MLPTLVQLLSLLPLGSPLASSAALLPRQNNVIIKSVVYTGTGCSAGSVATTLSPDGTTITLSYDSMEPYIGPGISPAEKTKSCIVAVRLGYPLGSRFEIAGTTYHGLANLPASMEANMQTAYHISSDGNAQTQAREAGELSGVYTTTDTIPIAWRIYSPCGQEEATVQASTRVTLTSRNSTASGGFDEEPPFALTVQQIHLRWSTCVGSG